MKLKLDLHTHPLEAMNYEGPSVKTVGRLLEAIAAKGLDGIGVTEHFNLKYGLEMKRIADESYPDSKILLIPGHEIEIEGEEVVELFLPQGVTFRFLAHPGYPRYSIYVDERFHGIEIDNGMHNWHINKPAVRQVAEQHDLIVLTDSDAHYLDKIGTFYNEIDLDDLVARATRDSQQVPSPEK